MSYEKHNFQSGDILMASQLNDIDDQLYENAENVNEVSSHIYHLENTTDSPVPSGKVWTTTATGAEWKTPTGGGESSSNYVTPEMYGAVGDGITDDTIAFSRALENGYVILEKNKRYKINGIDFKNDVEIEGYGSSVIISGLSYGDKSGLIGVRNTVDNISVVLKDMDFEVSNHIACFFDLSRMKSLTMDNCFVNGSSWENGTPLKNADGYDSGATEGIVISNSHNITIKNCNIINMGTYGVYLDYCSNAVIYRNTFEWCGRGGIYLRHENKYVDIIKNSLSNTVRNFSVNDGSIDLYGPANKHVKIIGNDITRFGSTLRFANGITVCSGTDIVVNDNHIVADETSFCQAALMIEQRDVGSDSYEIDGIFIENNYLSVYYEETSLENGKTELNSVGDYCVRFMGHGAINKNLYFKNNIALGKTKLQQIEVRHTLHNAVFESNTFNEIIFVGEEREGREHSSISISNNKVMSYIRVENGKDISICGNKVNEDYVNYDEPIRVINSNGVIVENNNVWHTSVNWLFDAGNNGIVVGNSNVMHKPISNTESMTYTSESEKIMLESYSGVSLVASGFVNGLYNPMLYVYGNHSEIENGETPSLSNRHDYVPFNADGSLETIVNYGSNSTVLTDSVPKYAMKVRYKSDSNCEDEEGSYWIGDYRDWANGKDVHMMGYYELTGKERFRKYNAEPEKYPNAYILDNVLQKPGVGNSVHQVEHNTFVTNFDNCNIYYQDRPLYFSNNEGSSLLLNVDKFDGYATIDSVMGFIENCYNNGVPLKIWYELKAPYETEVPSSELDAYKSITAESRDFRVSTNLLAYIKSTFIKGDDYGNMFSSYSYSRQETDDIFYKKNETGIPESDLSAEVVIKLNSSSDEGWEIVADVNVETDTPTIEVALPKGYKKLVVYGKMSANAQTWVYLDVRNNAYKNYFTLAETSNKYIYDEFEAIDGILFSTISYGSDSDGISSIRRQARGLETTEENPIVKIKVYTGNANVIKAGSYFKVYAK